MRNSDKIGLRIRSVRESKGYSQEYMAEMLDISQSCYANLESGKSGLSVERLLAITEILELNVVQLFADHQQKDFKDASVASKDRKTQDGFSPEIKQVYDQLISELREEVIFLRDLVMHRKSDG